MTPAFEDTLIMAAGRGNRMGVLTEVIPKAMSPYKGETLIGNSLKKLQAAAQRIHITVGYKSAMLSEHVVTRGVSSIFNTEGHSNSWWIYHTLMQYVDTPVLVLTCDNIVELNFKKLRASYEEAGRPACLVVPVTPIPGIEGDYIHHEKGLVKKLDRKLKSDIYCSGIQILNPRRINQLTRDGGDFYSVWEQLIRQKELRVSSVYPDQWFSVDTLEQLLKVA